jgi:hypothetical protein
VHVVAANVSPTLPLVANGSIEIAFDQYLLPLGTTRQAFSLHDLYMREQFPLAVAYDPVARIVTLTPPATLQMGQTYVLSIISPSSPTDPNGLRAISGATIAPADATRDFVIAPAGSGTPQSAPPRIDFCTDIFPILATACAGQSCHGGSPPGPAAGLRLDSPAAIFSTAVGRAAQGANTGALAIAAPPGPHFGVNMPIIDPGVDSSGGDPGNSWLLYKLLLAVPTANSPTGDGGATGCDGGAAMPSDVSTMHLVPWRPADTGRVKEWSTRSLSLSDYVPGREMPFPSDPAAPIGNASSPLTVDELERISRWIAQPTSAAAPLVPATCDCAQ